MDIIVDNLDAYLTGMRQTVVLFWFGVLPAIGFDLSRFWAGVLVLTAYTGTFVAESVRAGINSVAVGQAEAGRSLGLTFPQTMGIVIMPQALRTVVQPLGSIFIALIKNSALVTIISLENLTAVGQSIGTETADFMGSLAGVAVAYLVLTIPAGAAVGWIERRVAFVR